MNKRCNTNDCTCFIDKLLNKHWGACCRQYSSYYIYNFINLTKDEVDCRFYNCLKKRTWKRLAFLVYVTVNNLSITKGYWDKNRETA